ncbi:TlpA family protein disulfide reductase [Microscilla marina]|uniref:Thiol:disulfide interchange protein TlpA n=1 Tax=Microscilla marina ATCC 23134 TaxID=313606 RepID=A1ZKF4_MICM2|nr:TlpA disulfide reductase family protein [Microscilla marina]EAY29180.1 thiol:disulfide interchange protein TlpA [Microscilla marina ATCC 23134]
MKKIIFTLLLIAATTIVQAQEIKKIKLVTLEKLVNPQDDITYVVNFWATWCRPCVKELPYFERLQAKYSHQKVKVILVAVEDSEQKVKLFVQKKKIKAQVLLLDETKSDVWIPKVNKSWDGAIPVTLFINGKAGKREFHKGDLTEAELNKKVESILKQIK